MTVKFSDVKVHNEIELCEFPDLETKIKIEKALLRERISFYVKWHSAGFFSRLFLRKEDRGILCVNDEQKDATIRCLEELEKNKEIHVKFLNQKVDKVFF